MFLTSGLSQLTIWGGGVWRWQGLPSALASPVSTICLQCVWTCLLLLQSMGNQAGKQKEGKLTGTNADLRRLKVPALKEKLRAAGVPEDVMKDARRWELVDLLRDVANIGEGSSEFARKQRMSAAEMMQRKTRLCQEIWQRQVSIALCSPCFHAQGGLLF